MKSTNSLAGVTRAATEKKNNQLPSKEKVLAECLGRNLKDKG